MCQIRVCAKCFIYFIAFYSSNLFRFGQISTMNYMWHDQGKLVTCWNISILSFLRHFVITPKCLILMQTPLKLDIWLQSCEEFVNAKNNIEQRNLNPVFANISKTIWLTFDSFLLIMSQMPWDDIRTNSKVMRHSINFFDRI